jgi:ribonuclease/clavin/mitogillin
VLSSPDLLPLQRAVQSCPDASVVACGLVRLPLATVTIPPATTTNHYLVGSARTVLVDPSAPDLRDQDRLVHLVCALQELGWELHALLLTHHHSDHVGAADALRLRLNVPLLAHAETAKRLPHLGFDGLVQDGDVVAEDVDGSRWTALHTPGHAPGHLVLQHDRSGGMVAGDMVAGTGTIVVDPNDGTMADYLASLRRMAAAGATWLAPSHGRVLADGQTVIAHYLHHRLEREAVIHAALADDVVTPEDLLPRVYGDVSPGSWRWALWSLMAHLIHLEAQGRAQCDHGRWCRRDP